MLYNNIIGTIKSFPLLSQLLPAGASTSQQKTNPASTRQNICFFYLYAFAFFLLSHSAAIAACSDPATPGVDWQRCLRDGRPFVDVNLSSAKLRSAIFSRADLSNSNLSEVDGRRVKFLSAQLTNTKLDGADLREADFTKAILEGASLKNARLDRARFYQANLRGADLTAARLDDADLTRADLSGALWTDGQKRCGPQSIGQCK
ncbi:MAG: hypothetical protein CMF31_03115 [Kordiimonas sp.]|nr:hypothetical protein [Kordiimonas sp.]|tara:strand:+ start:847 stop:1458 length:612 start_codon:yes stop_codon:yes gene_type:complete